MQNRISITDTIQRVPRLLMIVLMIVLQLMIVAVAFMGGFLAHEWQYGDDLWSSTRSILPKTREFSLLSEAHTLLQDNADFSLPEMQALEYGMIRGMLSAVDEPYTTFVEPPQHELQSNQLQGKYGGIGVRLDRDDANNVYLYPFPDSPALEAGVKDGDRLLKVGALEVTPQTPVDDINAAIRGPVGQNVKITIGHAPDYTPVEVSIKRAEIGLPSVMANQVPGVPAVGMVRINVIANTTPDEVVKAVENLQSLGATHFIIDIRNNGGGLVEAGVNTARLFLEEGVVIEEQYRGKPVKTFEVEKTGPLADLPVVIMVNKGTASAAEIFAGAIKGRGRAPVVGTPTYGKDSIQLVFRLSDGSSLHVTSAHWWVPGLEPAIGGSGVQPDVLVDEAASDTELRKIAIDTVQK